MKPVLIAALLLLSFTVSAENLVLDRATKEGIKQCLPAVSQMSNFLLGDAATGINASWGDRANEASYRVVAEKAYIEHSSIALMDFTPQGNGKCPSGYTQIFYEPVPCSVQEQRMKGFEFKGALRTRVAYYKADSLGAYLMPAGNGCLVIRQEFMPDGNGSK